MIGTLINKYNQAYKIKQKLKKKKMILNKFKKSKQNLKSYS